MSSTVNHLGIQFPWILKQVHNTSENDIGRCSKLKSPKPLKDGFYCFGQENLINPSIIHSSQSSNWCFAQGTTSRLGLGANDNDFSLPSNQQGFYLAMEDQAIFIPSKESSETIDISTLPVTTQLMPSILFPIQHW